MEWRRVSKDNLASVRPGQIVVVAGIATIDSGVAVAQNRDGLVLKVGDGLRVLSHANNMQKFCVLDRPESQQLGTVTQPLLPLGV